ncbi:MAG: hypothetical protein ACYCW6_28795 [Candidatus Xenobia bacterium]
MRWVVGFCLMLALPVWAAGVVLWPDVPADVVSKLYAHHVEEGAKHHWVADELSNYLVIQDGDVVVALTLGQCNAARIDRYACAFQRKEDDWTTLGACPIHLGDVMELRLTEKDLKALGVPASMWTAAKEGRNWHVYPEPMGGRDREMPQVPVAGRV